MKIALILTAYTVTLTVAVASIFLLGRAGWPVMPVFVMALISTRLLGALRHLWGTGTRREARRGNGAGSHRRSTYTLDPIHLDLVTHRKAR